MICPKAKSATHCLTELFSIYQNKHGTIRRRDDYIVVQSSHHNIFKIDWFYFIAATCSFWTWLLCPFLQRSLVYPICMLFQQRKKCYVLSNIAHIGRFGPKWIFNGTKFWYILFCKKFILLAKKIVSTYVFQSQPFFNLVQSFFFKSLKVNSSLATLAYEHKYIHLLNLFRRQKNLFPSVQQHNKYTGSLSPADFKKIPDTFAVHVQCTRPSS